MKLLGDIPGINPDELGGQNENEKPQYDVIIEKFEKTVKNIQVSSNTSGKIEQVGLRPGTTESNENIAEYLQAKATKIRAELEKTVDFFAGVDGRTEKSVRTTEEEKANEFEELATSVKSAGNSKLPEDIDSALQEIYSSIIEQK